MVEFPTWAPDLGDFGHDQLVTCRNVFPGFNFRKEPVPALADFTAALPSAWQGGAWFKYAAAGTTYTALLAAASAGLYTLSASAATSVYTVSTSTQWFFDQFGDNIIGSHGGAPVKYTMSSGAGAALGGSPPHASFVAVFKDMVALAGGDDEQSNTVYNSALNDCEGWTVGTDQADFTDIPDGGPITGLAGGENLRVFQDSAINILDYVGGDDILVRRKISASIGALCQGSIATLGGVDYFYHRSGFHRLLPGAEPEPIGAGKVDVTFRNTYADSEIQTHLRSAIDPIRKLILWSMPDRIWALNTVTGEWSDIAISGIGAVTLGATSSVTLETIAVSYPLIEDVPVSFDDPRWQGGYPLLLVADSATFKLRSFSGSNLAPTLTMAQQELFPGRVAHARVARVVGDITSGVSVSIASRARQGDSPSSVSSQTIRPNGDTPIRASGKFLQPGITAEAGASWNYLLGLELAATPGGVR